MERYSFNDFKKDIVVACLESMSEYKGKIYSLSIESGRSKFFSKNKEKPLWIFHNETDDVEIIRSKHETICDEIYIDGQTLEDIWNDVKTI